MQTIYFQSANQERFPLHVVGEESYQSNLQNIVPYDANEKQTFKDDSFTAELILDDDNSYDKGNAVRIVINGQIVGYLSKQHAAKYRRALAALNLSSVVGQCAAAIFGRKKDDRDDMLFDVWLDLDLDNLQPEKPSTPAPAPTPVATPRPKAVSDFPPPPGSRVAAPPIPTTAPEKIGPITVTETMKKDILAGPLIKLWGFFNETPQRRRIGLIALAIFVPVCLCLCCMMIVFAPPSNGKPTATAVNVEQASTQIASTLLAAASQTIEAGITPTPKATETLENTETPASTDTPLPTEIPGLIRPGTHLVGKEIKPGIYTGSAGSGLFSSCYWTRLKDLSGEVGAIIANANSTGKFYIEVKATDFAVETRCTLIPLESTVAPTEFPKTLAEGMYLVGRDIQPGTYKGQAGTEITDSCYWARLRNVSGEFDGIITNDNATGQFYITVAATDFALSVRCDIEFVQQ